MFHVFFAVHLFSQHYADFLLDVSKVSVSKFAAIFGPNHLVYDIHLFSHLFNFVKLHGCLDRFSCFPHESELGQLKHYIHGPKLPAVQLYRRLAERVGLDAVERKIFLDDVGLRLRPSATAGCHRFIQRDVFFRKIFPDNCILLDGQPVVIVDFSGDTIEYQKFKTVFPFYTHVLISTDLLVFQCSDLQHTRPFASVNQISRKCLSLSCRDTRIYFPILHTLIDYILCTNLLRGTLPKYPLKSCTYEVYRQCKTFPDALSAQKEALDSGHTASAEPNDERLVRQSRRKQNVYQSYYDGCSTKKRLPSDFTNGSDRDSSGDITLFASIVISPPTPKRLCTKPTATISSIIPVQDASPVPRDAPMLRGTYVLFHYHHLESISSSTYTTLPAVDDPEPRSFTPILRTNSSNSKASVISPDMANLILNEESREEILVTPETAYEAGCFSTHRQFSDTRRAPSSVVIHGRTPKV
ncbi:hypothetical protein T265_02689 [Opisthorchis viverrini]|uniref:Uncharacterized protein n=1 Tax=Opisthorchis viverrini TaxID=6198 RepID=A0A074ZU59_OPIVI|nr:hypothetical protein T265_02689 [Opisthorchis viverrini]KER31013.1 hypothetical protein T265_02689 [Opisthorchis viverrini]